MLKSQPAPRSRSLAASLPAFVGRAPAALLPWLVLAVTLNVLLAIVVFGFGARLGPEKTVSNLFSFLIPLATAHLCFPTSRRRWQVVPTLLGSATMVFAAGRALYFALTYRQTASPHIAVKMVSPWSDVAWVAAYPLLMAAFLWWPTVNNPPSQRFRNFLDLVVGAAGLWAFTWVFFVFPELTRNWHDFFWESLTIARPVLALVLLACLFQFFRRRIDSRFAYAARLAFLGAAVVIVADGVYGPVLLEHWRWGLGWLEELGWPLGCTLLNLAGFLYASSTDDEESVTDTSTAERKFDVELALSTRPWYSLVPYTLIPAVAFLILYALARPAPRAYEVVILLAAVVMIASLLLRQVLTIKDNATLLTRLQRAFADLAEQKNELKQSNSDLKDALSRLAVNNDDLAKANAQLAQLVTIDGMTGLENHRAFQQHLRLEVDAAKRHRHPLSLIMADVDFFKRYNDEFGHPAGDEVLRQIAKAIMDEVGENAYPARYGGEEFSVVLPYLTANEAKEVAERIQRAVSTRVRVRRRITMSFGVATMEPHWTAETLVNEADRALYAAKGWGRNRVVLVTDLDRQRLSLDIIDEGTAEFDPNDPMGLAAILSAGLRNHPQALGIEPDSQLAGGLLGTLELKDVETRDHSERVMWYAMRLAQSVIDSGISTMTQQELRSLAYGALLHDIGKIGVPEHILKYPGTLDLEMKAVIREHPRLGAQIVQRFPTLDLALAVIRNHHERWDGRGYPSGLRGMDIPLVARIFTVVDALEAMTSKRPYSEPISIESVTERLMAGSGTSYDPAILRAYALVPAEEWIRIRQRESVLTEQIGQTTAISV